MVKKMQEEFYRLSNQSQAAFAKKLTPTNIAFLGIKIPQIKEFVKSHAITYDELYHIKLNQYVEQDILFGLFLNKLGKVKNELYYKTFLYFIKYLDNWMTCDTFVCNTQFKKNEYDKLLSIITYILQQQPMEVRCGLILLKKYFIKELPFDEIFKMIEKIKYGDYYVDMGCAWLLCTMGCYDFEYIYNHFSHILEMSSFVYKKTIQKMRESYLITSEQKQRLNKLNL